MKYLYILTVIALYCASCSILYAQEQELKLKDDNLLKFEFAFANEAYGTKGDFLLDSPRNISTTRNNDIVVFDDVYIKIYDSKGNGKKILGGKGQGPGEFDNMYTFMYSTSPSDYFTILESEYFTVYDNNFKFINKKRIRNDTAINKFLEMNNHTYKDIYSHREMYFILENEKLYMFMHMSKPHHSMNVLLYDNNKTGEIKPLIYTEDPRTKTTSDDGKFVSVSALWGRLLYIPLPNRLLAYTNSDEEVFKDGRGYYKIHIMSIDDLSEKMVITKDFTPKKYPDNFIEDYKKRPGMSKETEAYIKKRVYEPYLWGLKSDSLYIFANKETVIKIGKMSYYTYDVFDSRNGKYLSTFTTTKFLSYVRNGYGYVIGTHSNGYNEIQVYKLDPKIYGK